MSMRNLLWGAELDHIRFDTDDLDKLSAFYRAALGMVENRLEDGSRLLQGPGRRLVLGPGNPGEQPYSAFRFPSRERLEKFQAALFGRGHPVWPSPSPVFGEGAFAVTDPDGRQMVFGLERADLPAPRERAHEPAAKLPGTLQHVVVSTTDLPAMIGFYQEVLGFVPSDHVVNQTDDGDEVMVVFYRSTPLHHSFAVFKSDAARPDHHSYETTCWNDIRDWADHFSRLEIKLWWGPGRHGPGNNLFIMIEDPHGHKVEISAEQERMAEGQPVRNWPHNERSLNLWGSAWMRS